MRDTTVLPESPLINSSNPFPVLVEGMRLFHAHFDHMYESEARLANSPRTGFCSAYQIEIELLPVYERLSAAQANAGISSTVVVGLTTLVESCNSVVVRGFVRRKGALLFPAGLCCSHILR